MFNFFKKPVGIYLRDEMISVVQLKKDAATPVLEFEHHEALPAGAIESGLLKQPELLLPILKKLQGAVKSSQCVVSLPVVKSYSGVVKLPKGVEDADVEEAIKPRIGSVIPVPLSELYYEKSVLRGLDEEHLHVFIVGIEKTLVQAYQTLFKSAGWDKSTFVLESIALGKAIPVKFSQYPAVMFIHSFGSHAIMSSMYQGRVFDGYLTEDLQQDFIQSYQSYIQQLGLAPTHIVLSGDHAGLTPLTQLNFKGQMPKFVPAQFRVELKGQKSDSVDLIVSTGLSLCENFSRKNNGPRLLNLLD